MSKKVHSQKKIFRGAYNDGSDDVAGMPSDFIKHESLKLTVIYFSQAYVGFYSPTAYPYGYLEIIPITL